MSIQISTLVRFHDFDQIERLENALFSLECQRLPPSEVIILCQDFTQDQIKSLSDTLGASFSCKISIENVHTEEEETDARTRLLNHGIRRSAGEYIHILDYDDWLYENAYSSFAALAEADAYSSFLYFCRVERGFQRVYDTFDYLCTTDKPFKGRTLEDLLSDNFCPIHSYLINKGRAHRHAIDIFFDETYEALEDYDFLLRYCHLGCNFKGVCDDILIGIYNFRNDYLNSTILDESEAPEAMTMILKEKRRKWENGREKIRILKDKIQRE